MLHKERRRSHGEMLEKAVLEELTRYNILEPIPYWDGLIRPSWGQPYFVPRGDHPIQPLDEVAYVRNENQEKQLASVIEVKAMRALDWHDWLDHWVIHKEKVAQHKKHIQIAKDNNLLGVCIIAVNKDSSEYLIRVYDKEDNLIPEWDYEC